MFGKIKNIAQKTATLISKPKAVLSSVQIEVTDGQRTIKLDKDDAVIILKGDGKSLIIDRGIKGDLAQNEELAYMLWLYAANQEFVDLLRNMYDDVLEEVNAEREKDSGVVAYTSGERV